MWPNDKKVGEDVHFNRLHNIKKNYQTLLNMAKGRPLNHNGALSFAHPKMIYFSGKCTFVLHTIYYWLGPRLWCYMSKCRFLSSRDANYLHLVEMVITSLLCKILASLYLQAILFHHFFFFGTDTQSLKSSLKHLSIPFGSLIYEIPDCLKVMFITFKINFHFGSLVGPMEMSKWAHLLGAIKLSGPRRVPHWLWEPRFT